MASGNRVEQAPLLAGRGDPSAWEFGRNDGRLNVGSPPVQRVEWSETWNRNRTFTNNGRPREFSSTFVRTYSLRRSN
jgi:hypothetical protein